MKSYGNINMYQNQLQQACLEMQADWPTSPKVGQVLFKNKVVYICVEISNSIPVWVPLTREIEMYMHTQPSPATVWVVNHNLNAATPVVQIYDQSDKMVFPNEIEIISNTQLRISFAAQQSGRAVIIAGSIEGTQRPAYGFEYTQSTLSDTWTVIHGLGYYPITRVFIGNQEVQPLSITHDSVNQTTIRFTTSQVGTAKFI